MESKQQLNRVRPFVTTWTAAHQACLAIINAQNLLKFRFMSWGSHPNIIASVIPFFYCLQSFPASESSNELALHIRWPKYWSFSFSISPSSEDSGLIGLISLLSKGLLKVFSKTTTQKHQSFSPQSSLWSNSLSLSVFLITDILESMSWYLIVVFIYFPND